MTDPRDTRTDDTDDDAFPLVSKEDIGSASRSCAAIILILLLVVLVAIVFIVVQTIR